MFAHATRGTRLDGSKWYPAAFKTALAAARIADHVPPFHDARHNALTNMPAAGSSPVAIMATAGHRSFSTTKRYLHLAGQTFQADADALELRLLGGQASTELSTDLGST